jgi:hypothetical protein
MSEIITFGDVRKVIVDTILELKSGTMDISRGMAIAANIKTLNDNIQAEINAAKVSIRADEVGKNFGEVLSLGRRPILGNDPLCNDTGFYLEDKK